MNKITDEHIFSILNRRLTEAKKLYPWENIFGIYVHGLANYGFAAKPSDIQTEVVVIPTLLEVANNEIIDKTLDSPLGKIHFRDVRNVVEATKRQELEPLESLYTKYVLVNHRYVDIYESYFKGNLNTIVDNIRAARACGNGIDGINSITDISQDGINYIRYNFLKKFINNNDIYKSLEVTADEEQYTWELLREEKHLTDTERAEMLLVFLKAKEMKVYDVDEPAEILKHAIFNIIEVANQYTNPVIKFLKITTEQERAALAWIISEVGREGYLSISALSRASAISRHTYDSLILKLKETNVALVETMGANGTHFKLLYETLLDLRR